MARKLSVLELLLIIFCLIVVVIDILLLLLVLEEPSGKGDACGLEGWVKEVPSKCQRDYFILLLFNMPLHCGIQNSHPQLV